MINNAERIYKPHKRDACARLGTKLQQKTFVNEALGVQTDYSAGFVYEDNVLNYFGFSEGRIRKITPIISESYQYEYDLTDHLGNVRATFKAIEGYDYDTHNTVYGLALIQADDYYPFGLKMPDYSFVASGADENKFTYNGKELEDEFGLNWYHYGARFYDPTVGRWWAVDPADEFKSPYTYVANNPIVHIDPDGAFTTKPIDIATYDENGILIDYKVDPKVWQTQIVNKKGDIVDIMPFSIHRIVPELKSELSFSTEDFSSKGPRTEGFFEGRNLLAYSMGSNRINSILGGFGNFADEHNGTVFVLGTAMLTQVVAAEMGIMNGRIPSGFEAVKPNAFVLTSVNNGNNYSIIKMIQVINPLIGNRNGVAADVTIWSNMTRSQIIQTRNNPNTQRIIEAIEHIDLGLTNDNNDE